MKKLFAFGTLLTISLFLFGCQSESPVSPNENTGSAASLQKPSLSLSVEYSYPNITCTWNSIGGTANYYIEFNSADWSIDTVLAVVPAVHGQKKYEKDFDLTGFPSGEYVITLAAESRRYNVKAWEFYSLDIP